MFKIKKCVFVILLSVLCLTAIFAKGELETEEREKFLELQGSSTGIVILPESFLRAYDPVTVIFKEEIGPGGEAPLDDPLGFISMEPAHPGEFRWKDARTLLFYPTIPWKPLTRYVVTAGEERKTLASLLSPPYAVSPRNGASNLEPIEELTIDFKEYLEPSGLANILTIETRPLPGVGDEGLAVITSSDYKIKMLDKTGSYYSYYVDLDNPIDYGKHITVKLRLAEEPSIPGSVAQYVYTTKSPFKVRGMGSGYVNYPVSAKGSVYTVEQAVNCGSGSSPLFIEFSEDLAYLDIETVKKLVSFEPAVKNLTHSVSGSRLYLYFDVDRETPFKFSLNYTSLESRNGRTLGSFGETSFYFYYTQLSSYLRWTEGHGIMEVYGPQFFPMEGRALEKVDLRIYKIDPYSRNFWPFPSKPVDIYEDVRPPMPGEEPDYGTRLESQIKLLGTPHFSRIISLPIDENSSRSRFGLELKPFLSQISGPQRPGTYLVGYRIPGSSDKRFYVRVNVTDLSLSTVEEEHGVRFIVTSLNTGAPIPGAEVSLDFDYKDQWRTLISGVTDATGQYFYEHTYDLDRTIKRIVVRYNEDVLILDPYNPPPSFQNNHWFRSSGRWLDWLNNSPRKELEKAGRKGFILTERPIYRPDEEVHLLGYVRLRKQGQILKAEAGRTREVIVNGPGRKSWRYPINLKEHGNFYLKFDEKDIPTGSYTAYLMDTDSGETLASIGFKKEAYRIPRFEVNLSGPSKVPLDQVFQVTLTADYYAGGRVAGQPVTWEISEYLHEVRPAAFGGYIFSSDQRFSGGSSYYSSGSRYQEDVTDSNGSSILTLNPAASDNSLPKRYFIQATVRGADTQTVTSSKTVYALPPFMIGLKSPGFVKDEKVIRPEIVVIDHNEKLLAGKTLLVKLYQRQWHSYLTESDFTTGKVKYNSDVVDNLILEREVVSLDEPLKLDFPVNESGVYVVEVQGKDNLGRMQKVLTDLYVAGDSPVTWKKTRANVFETTTDKNRYVPGEQASILLKSPFQEARALVIVESPIANSYYWVDIKGGQGFFTFNIEKNMTPRLPVHAILYRGRLKSSSSGGKWNEDRGKPIAMARTTWITVDPAENQVKLTLIHDKTALPGSKARLKIQMTDYYDRPVDGIAALWLVDRAVLALEKEQFSDPLDRFIDPVYSHLRIRETRNEVLGFLSLEEVPGGGGWDEMEEAMGLAKSSLMEQTTVRKNFKTTAYFNDQVVITGGEGEVYIDLPDNLTDFAVRAIGLSDFDKFGIAKSTLSIRLPLIVQAALPRFVRPGDSFKAGGIGRVVEGSGGTGGFEVQTEGLSIEEEGKLTAGVSGNLLWEINRPQKIYFPFKLADNTSASEVSVSVAVKRDYDKVADAFKITLPVKDDIEKQQIVSFLDLKADADVMLPEMTEKARPGTFKRTVVLTTEPAVLKIITGMNYLIGYTHGCTEQRISKIYPKIALAGTFSKIGFEQAFKLNDEVFKELVKYLKTTLTSGGLYSFWPGSKGYVSLTAYVVEFLTLAKEAGYVFDQVLLTRSIAALKEALRSDYSAFIAGSAFRERIESLTALEAAGYYDSAYAQDLLVGALNGNLYSRGKIAHLFLKRNMDSQKNVQSLITSLWESTVFKLREKEEVFAGLQYVDSGWGGLALSSQTKTIAMVARALYRAEPDNPKSRLILDELISRGGKDGWGNTTNNAAALLVLGDILKFQEEVSGAYQFELHSGSSSFPLNTGGKSVFTYKDENMEKSFFKFKSGDKDQLPRAYVSLEYVPARLGSEVKKLNQGFALKREHLLYSRDNLRISTKEISSDIPMTYVIDDIVEEHVQVVSSGNRYFTAVRVPFAAGFEIMNPELATSPPEAKPTGTFTRQPDYSLYEDDQVTFYYDSLPPGTYDFYFRLKASFEGEFVQPPARAELMYDLKVKGRTDGARIFITSGQDEGK